MLQRKAVTTNVALLGAFLKEHRVKSETQGPPLQRAATKNESL
jgi:hypothetical protein